MMSTFNFLKELLNFLLASITMYAHLEYVRLQETKIFPSNTSPWKTHMESDNDRERERERVDEGEHEIPGF